MIVFININLNIYLKKLYNILVIVAVSPTLYENLGFDPVLPSRKRALATRM